MRSNGMRERERERNREIERMRVHFAREIIHHIVDAQMHFVCHESSAELMGKEASLV